MHLQRTLIQTDKLVGRVRGIGYPPTVEWQKDERTRELCHVSKMGVI